MSIRVHNAHDQFFSMFRFSAGLSTFNKRSSRGRLLIFCPLTLQHSEKEMGVIRVPQQHSRVSCYFLAYEKALHLGERSEPRKREFMSEAIVAKKDHYTYTSGKLPTYPSPKPIISLTAHLRQNVGLGEG